MFSLDKLTWAAFLSWMVLGLLVYFGYSRSRSHLQKSLAARK
jgi:APA family basic amino acid/polyamine antiporter